MITGFGQSGNLKEEKMDRFELLYQKYCSQMSAVIPGAMNGQSEFTEMVKEKLEDKMFIAVNESSLEDGFLYYDVWADDTMHCMVPVYGYYAKDEKAIVLLFQKLAISVYTGRPCEFSFNLYHNDSACIQALHMMQFGTMSEKCIGKLENIDEQMNSDIEIKQLSKDEITGNWNEIWHLTSEIVEHLKKSPVFYPGEEFTEDVYREFFLDESVELIVAKKKDEFIGIIEWNKENCELLTKQCPSVNVGEAYVLPSFRGTGLSKELLSYAKKRATENGAQYMWVEHGTANPNARGFWNKYFSTYQYELVRKV